MLGKTRPFLLLLGLAFFSPIVPASAEETSATLAWNETIRDVYLDGVQQRSVRVLVSKPARYLAIYAPSLERTPVVDLDTLEVFAVAPARFNFAADGSGVSSPALASAPRLGTATPIDGSASHLLLFDGHSLLVAPHQGESGPLSAAALWRIVPNWHARMDAYDPDPEAVAALRAVDRDLQLTIAFGTWCGDSRQYVPQVLKALAVADNPRLHLELVSLKRGFEAPGAYIRQARLTNVPTVIVERAGEELGRIVETPATNTFEDDLAAIIAGTPQPHLGRYDRGATVAQGTYRLQSEDGSTAGQEVWTLYDTDNGGSLLHSVINRGTQRTEVFHGRDVNGATRFIEVTRQDGTTLSRSRLSTGDSVAQLVTRGNDTGIIEQTIPLPAGTLLLTPSIADSGLSLGGSGEAATALRLSGAGQPAAARLETLALQEAGTMQVDTPAGSRRAHHLRQVDTPQHAAWWLDAEHGFPLRAHIAGHGRFELAAFERF